MMRAVVLRVMAVLLAGFVALGWLALPLEARAGGGLNEAETVRLLQDSWAEYKQNFIQADGRVIDYNGNVTTSEGQSYAMLRAFWMRDRETFDTTWRWAKDNLQIPRGDHLFSWKWGERKDPQASSSGRAASASSSSEDAAGEAGQASTWGALDTTSASDADQDIALALLLAYKEWKDPAYLDEAKLILKDIWERLTINAPIGRVLLPGDWPQKGRVFLVNPSYFSPAAYRVFDEMDRDHEWNELLDSSYEILTRSVAQTETHLPPDWVGLSMDNDRVQVYDDPMDSRSDFGYEAIRVYWRVGLDRLLSPLDKRSANVLQAKTMLPRYWKIRRDVPISLTWDGIVRHPELQSGAVYGAVLPAIHAQDPDAERDLVLRKIAPNLKPGGQWNTKNDYYPQNWLWFGLAIHAIYQAEPPYTRGSTLKRLSNLMRLPAQ